MRYIFARGLVWSMLAAAAMLGVAACDRGGAGVAAPKGSGKLTVVATTGMIADAARNIAGERAEVRALMGEGVDPHLYKPSPGDIRVLGEAGLVLYNGLHLEGRMGEVLGQLGAKRRVVAVAEGIDGARLLHAEEGGGDAAAHDPHVWFDVKLWMTVVEAVRDALIAADAPGAEAYRANTEKYLATLAGLDDEARAAMAAIPAERRVLVTAHDAFGYFGRAYGAEVMAIQGISTDSEASLREINRLVDVIVERKIPAVFVESSVPRKTVEALVEGAKARGHGVRVGGELFSDAMGAEGTAEGTYVGMVRHNVRVVVEGLGPETVRR